MDFLLSEREELLRKSVREFAEAEIPPKIEAMEKTGEFPIELLEPMARLGITGIIAPPEYGGVGLGYLARTIALEELGRVCAAIPMAMQVHHMADFWIVMAKTAEGAKGLSAFIVEKNHPGAKTGRVEHKIGLRGSNTGELVFDNCEIPKENILGQEGGGLAVALKTVSESGRPGMAATALGIINACLEEAAKFASERVLYGKPISSLQAISFYLADIYTELDICRLLCYRASWMKDQNMRCDNENARAKSYTCDAAVRCARNAVEIHGSYGILQEYKVQRLLRDAVVTVPAGGTGQIGKVVLARAALAPYRKKK